MIAQLALTVLLSVSPPDSLAAADGLSQPLSQALRARDYASAERLADRQLDLRRRFGESPSLELATSLTYLSLATRNLGDFSKAEDSARDALAMMIELYGRENGNTATALNNLAGALRLRGDLVGAEALYRESLRLRESLLGEDHAQLAGSHNNLGGLLRQLGDGAGAEEHLRRALEIAEANYGPEHRNVSLAHLNLASTLRVQDRFEEAQVELERAVANYEASADSVRLLQAQYEQVLCWLESGQGERGVALARELVDDFRINSELDVARARVLLGRTLLARGDVGAAVAALQRGRDDMLLQLGATHPEVVRAGFHLGEALLVEDSPRALEVLEECAASYEAARTRLALDHSRATTELLPSPYQALALARLRAGDEEGAWQAVESQNGRVLRELRQSALLDSEQSRRRAELLRELSEAEEALSQIEDDEHRAELRRRLLEAEAEWSRFQAELATTEQGDTRAMDLTRVLRSLDDRTAVVGWIPGYAYLLRRDGLQWVQLSAGVDEVKRRRLRGLLLEAADAPAFAAPVEDPALAELAIEFHDAMLAPLQLEGIEHLRVIAPPSLRGIPVELLAREMDLQFSYALSSFVLEPIPRARRRSLLVGNPSFAGETRYGSLPALRHSQEEVERCAEILGDATLLVEGEASEQRMRALSDDDALRSFSLLHFATHALADARHPEQSRLVLAQNELGDPVERLLSGEPVLDGTVSAAEIARTWQLDAKLVTLSACETALGKATDGEGYLGLAHALFEAGAQRLLVSLWAVDDEATSILMQRFYRNFAGAPEDPARALREAKQWIRTTDGSRFAHPYYWAAFVLVEG